ncbi:histone chaperone ASF1-like, partial [Pristis pectinata]|uniref:histone chaperone ASF1-like n=1 Tax=Pristis pectinata TaxID=685728 RepID=UPI00223D82F7
FQADAVNPSLIPDADAVGVTVILITCTYRIGYYVNNEYNDPELRENPPVKPDFSKLQRNILASNPRVARFHINSDDSSEKTEDSDYTVPNVHSVLSTSTLSSDSKNLTVSADSLSAVGIPMDSL